MKVIPVPKLLNLVPVRLWTLLSHHQTPMHRKSRTCLSLLRSHQIIETDSMQAHPLGYLADVKFLLELRITELIQLAIPREVLAAAAFKLLEKQRIR